MIERLRRLFGVSEAPPAREPLHTGRAGRERLEVHSPTWQFVAAWAQDEMDKARRKNDALSNSPDETAALRGEIRLAKRLLALAEPPRPPVKAPEQY